VVDQNLTRRVSSGANANGGNFERFGYGPGDVGGDAFQDYGERTGLLEAEGLVEELPGSDGRPSLGTESTLRGYVERGGDGGCSCERIPYAALLTALNGTEININLTWC